MKSARKLRKSARKLRIDRLKISNTSTTLSSKELNVHIHEHVCIENQWMKNTKFLRYLELFDKCFELSPALWQNCVSNSQEIILCLSKHCWGRNDARGVLNRLWEVGDGRRKNRQNLVLAFLLLLKYESSDGCFALIERVKDRVYRCDSAQKQAYTMVIQLGAHAYECYNGDRKVFKTKWDSVIPKISNVKASLSEKTERDASEATSNVVLNKSSFQFNKSSKFLSLVKRSRENPFFVPLTAEKVISSELNGKAKADYSDSLCKIHSMVEDYLDIHKENAFNSSLHEPARFYFDLCGNTHHRDHVNVHGINGWLCLIRGWFGCQIPIIPLSDDQDTFKGCADVWSGLSNDAWNIFSDPSNFGKDFEGVKGLNRRMLKDSQYGGYHSGSMFIGRTAKDMERAARKKDKKFLSYANKFAFFFTKQFLVKRMFEVLNAEANPAYIGFRKACDSLYPIIKKNFLLEEDSLLEFLYDYDMMYLDINKATFFFWWCGVCKQSSIEDFPQFVKSASAQAQKKKMQTCPICFEEKEDVHQIPHWKSQGDISEHKMCNACAAQYQKNICPFCQEVSLKEEILSCIQDFVQQVKARSSGGDPNELAALLERWQFFEMEYGDNPKVIYRVAILVLRDQEFMNMLKSGVQYQMSWMRDAAGVIFRLYSLSIEGNLTVTSAEQSLLNDAYSTIFNLAKTEEIKSQGHYHGALYTQAMVPYICALQSQQSTHQLGLIVKDVGNFISSHFETNKHLYPYLKNTIPERIIDQYMPVVSANVWGGKENDPVWKTFFN